MSAWLAWFGLGRLALSACCVVVVVLGVAWLIRSPAPATETRLPFAPAVTGPPEVTLPSLPGSAVDEPSPAVVASLPTRLVVHVAGAVERPGVYELGSDERVDAAITRAGGPTPAADLDGLNLASLLGDGQRIYVPQHGEIDPVAVASAPPHPSEGATAASGPIDINTATAVELQTLPGVGPATAAAIVDDRDRNGPFASIADLERVPGIGPAKLAAIADAITV